jgi:hypothetical protein
VGLAPALADHIKTMLVALRMPRALEAVDALVRQLERGEVTALEAIDTLLTEGFTLRENRRIKTALLMARLSTLKTCPASTSPSSPRSIAAASWRSPS